MNQTRVGMGWNLGCKLGLSRLMLMNSALYLDRCLKCVSHSVVSDSATNTYQTSVYIHKHKTVT